MPWCQQHLSALYIAVLSGTDRVQDIGRAYDMGAHSYLTKPVKEADLRNLANIFPQHWA